MSFRIPMTMTNKSHSNIAHMIHDEDSPFSNCSSFVRDMKLCSFAHIAEKRKTR